MSRSPEFIALVIINDDQPLHAEDEDGASSSTSTHRKIQPLALQNVGGKPRMDGILNWIEDSGILDVVILAPEWQESGINSYLRSRKSSAKDILLLPGEAPSSSNQQQNMKIDLLELDDEHASDSEIIRAWSLKNPYKAAELVILTPEFTRDWPKTHTLLLPLVSLLDKQRMEENLITTALLDGQAIEDAQSSKKKNEDIDDPIFMVAYDAKTSTLLDIRDLEDFEEDVSMRFSLFPKHPNVTLSSRQQLSHVYVCLPSLLTHLNSLPSLHSFAEEVLPFLSKAQWQRKLLSKAISVHKISSKSSEADLDELAKSQNSERMLGEKATVLAHSQVTALRKSSVKLSQALDHSNHMRVACIVTR